MKIIFKTTEEANKFAVHTPPEFRILSGRCVIVHDFIAEDDKSEIIDRCEYYDCVIKY